MLKLCGNFLYGIAHRIGICTILSLIIYTCIILLYLFLNSKNPNTSSNQSSTLYESDANFRASFINSFGRLQSVLSPQLQWCTSNPFLRQYNQTTILDLELKWFEWTRNKLPTTYNMLKEYALSAGSRAGDIIHLAYPNSLPLPCPYSGGLKRYGGSDDGSKILCGLESLKPSSTCIVYSLGSGNQFKFEMDLLNKTLCEIHVYDCTTSAPKNTIEDLTFHQICMGEGASLQRFIYPYTNKKSNNLFSKSSIFRSYHQILKDNGHTHVHVLKMDIEGGEYSVFTDILRHPAKTNLPYQISFESHWWNTDIYHAILHQEVFAELWKYGYRFLQHEGGGDPSCIEWTMMRVFC